jgi:NADP-dependent 3-hydroxy acid dehydrogenase YdfG
MDILVNSAGIVHFGNIENTLELDMDKINNVNLKGVYNFVRVVIVGLK